MSSNILSVDPDAHEVIADIRDNEPGDSEFGLLLEITGITGLQFVYELSFMPVADADEGSFVEKHGDLSVILKERDRDRLEGALIKIGERGLSIENPNSPSPLAGSGATTAKGTLEGPLVDRVTQVIEEEINPSIASHGGATRLVSIDDDNVVYLELMGGCQGCGMASVTLQQGIERILMERVPEVTAIKDSTDHAGGENPFYEAAKK
jgi:Fe/S biogenesis protein NfuA